jgi:hypothetical protein
MKIKLSKSQWESIGAKAGWIKTKTAKEIYNPKLNTDEAKSLWFKMSDYLVFADDPSYKVAMAFRKAIDKIRDLKDKEEMKKYFESEFGGSHTSTVGAWDYYK